MPPLAMEHFVFHAHVFYFKSFTYRYSCFICLWFDSQMPMGNGS